MKIDFEMNYEEFIWICKMTIRCDDNGYEIDRISRNQESNDIEITLKAIVLHESCSKCKNELVACVCMDENELS